MDEHDVLLKLATEADQRSKSNAQRIDALSRRQDALDRIVQAICGIQKDIDYTKKDVTSMKKDIEAIKEAPKKRYDAAIIALISTGVGSILGAILSLVLGR